MSDIIINNINVFIVLFIMMYVIYLGKNAYWLYLLKVKLNIIQEITKEIL